MDAPVDPCVSCKRPLRRQGTSVEDAPGTVLLAAEGMCWACYRAERRGDPKPARRFADEEPVVPVRTLLRPTVFRELEKHAAVRGTTVGGLLCLLADASLKRRG